MNQKSQRQLLYAAGNGEYRLLLQNLSAFGLTDVRDCNGNTPLILAAQNGKANAVRTLLDAGSDIHASNFYNENALILASRAARHKVVSILLERGGLFEPLPVGNHRAIIMLNISNNPVLQFAGDAGAEVCLSGELVAKPSTLQIQRVTKLMCKVIDLLILSGSDVNARYIDYGLIGSDDTPLHLVANSGLDAFVDLLIERGADLNAEDGEGFTPYYWAKMFNYEATMSVLLKHGAKAGDQ
jgi:uncharacterized protein